MPFMFAFFVYQGIATGMGDTLGPLKVNLVAVVLNALLDPVLIFGLGPFPRVGRGRRRDRDELHARDRGRDRFATIDARRVPLPHPLARPALGHGDGRPDAAHRLP